MDNYENLTNETVSPNQLDNAALRKVFCRACQLSDCNMLRRLLPTATAVRLITYTEMQAIALTLCATGTPRALRLILSSGPADPATTILVGWWKRLDMAEMLFKEGFLTVDRARVRGHIAAAVAEGIPEVCALLVRHGLEPAEALTWMRGRLTPPALRNLQSMGVGRLQLRQAMGGSPEPAVAPLLLETGCYDAAELAGAPLQRAFAVGDLQFIERMLLAGVKPPAQIELTRATLELLCAHGLAPHELSRPQLWAATTDMLELLIQKGMTVDQLFEHGVATSLCMRGSADWLLTLQLTDAQRQLVDVTAAVVVWHRA